MELPITGPASGAEGHGPSESLELSDDEREDVRFKQRGLYELRKLGIESQLPTGSEI
ncbi:hypothetical protein ACP70R_048285 [Stipagrostis hirtigluma subsp. patula]